METLSWQSLKKWPEQTLKLVDRFASDPSPKIRAALAKNAWRIFMYEPKHAKRRELLDKLAQDAHPAVKEEAQDALSGF